jgi:hypothetical protein
MDSSRFTATTAPPRIIVPLYMTLDTLPNSQMLYMLNSPIDGDTISPSSWSLPESKLS